MSERKAFPYTVLLLKPQEIAASYGKDIVLCHVEEDSPDEAMVTALYALRMPGKLRLTASYQTPADTVIDLLGVHVSASVRDAVGACDGG